MRSTFDSPTAKLTSIGKNTITAQISMCENSPSPNQTTSSGASASIGIACVPAMYGERMLANRRDFASGYANTSATTSASRKPNSASRSVAQMCCQITPFLASSHHSCATA